MRRSHVIALAIVGLLLAGAGSGYAAGKLPKNSVGTPQLSKNSVTSAKVKNGSLKAADLSAEARAALRGPAPAPAPAAAPAAVSGFGMGGTLAIPDGGAPMVSLTGPGDSGKVTVDHPARLVAHAALTIGNSAFDGEWSVVRCQLQLDKGTGFADFGLFMYTESIGNSSHDEAHDLALTAGVDLGPGSYDVRVVCRETSGSAGSAPIARTAALTVVATPR